MTNFLLSVTLKNRSSLPIFELDLDFHKVNYWYKYGTVGLSCYSQKRS